MVCNTTKPIMMKTMLQQIAKKRTVSDKNETAKPTIQRMTRTRTVALMVAIIGRMMMATQMTMMAMNPMTVAGLAV